MQETASGVLLDLDGTLVDTVYLHVVAWQEALRQHGHEVPAAQVHAAIGMGADRLLPWLLGGATPRAGEIADAHAERFLELADPPPQSPGAEALLADLEARGVGHVLASSASGRESAAMLGALATDPLTVDSESVRASKPAPDLLLAACGRLGVEATQSVLVGDSPWDAEAAARLGMRMIGVRTGGFSDAALLRHGASDVVADPRALVGRL